MTGLVVEKLDDQRGWSRREMPFSSRVALYRRVGCYDIAQVDEIEAEDWERKCADLELTDAIIV